jgi:imidazole glycerol-phosphate synthase subunit HisF
MRRIRVIPVLLLQNGGLVKTIKFKNPSYVGDPINAVRIFNEKEVDEIVVLDIGAQNAKRGPDFKSISEIASEAFIPLAYGGGINNIEEVKELFYIGVEKVVFNFSAFHNPGLLTQAAKLAGSQSIVASMDVKKNWLGKPKVFVNNASHNTGIDPVVYARRMEDIGAGEIFLTAVDRDGTYEGYDLELTKLISSNVRIPVISCGGASSTKDFSDAVKNGASAVAAGSMFVFQRPHRAVLISYPSQQELNQVFSAE